MPNEAKLEGAPRPAIVDGPLRSVDEWDDIMLERYDQPHGAAEPHVAVEDKDECEQRFRNYEEGCPDHVREFYRQNHQHQTVAFVEETREKYLPLQHAKMSVWEAIESLNAIVDESDPDTDLPQIVHAVQAAEAIRADGLPRWMILTGLIHDLGKVLTLFGEPQWAVVGDTFPVGCRFSEAVVFHDFFQFNPDHSNPGYQTECGIYEKGCGLDSVLMSWGHDEYMYHVVKDRLPAEALAVIRYHSFYAWHREGAYQHLISPSDTEKLRWVRSFNKYDLYTKTDQTFDLDDVLPYYEELVNEYLPGSLDW